MTAVVRVGGPSQPTPEEAADAHLMGWNLCCARCGLFGARWCDGERPGRDIALCDEHADELVAERRRHAAAMAVLLERRHPQPVPAPTMASIAKARRLRAQRERAR